MVGPLDGVRVVELAGIGPGPFCGMVLADFGADVVRIDRPSRPRLDLPERPNARPSAGEPSRDPLARSRRSIALDLKQPGAVDVVLRMVDGADVLFEGYRPGVAERLGVGPDTCLARNPGLVYGRMTGWGQYGPMAPNAGHDLNYIALAGALEGMGRAGQPPTPAANLVGDFGGGGMLLALGIVAALFERSRSGQGQVVDAAMVDGSALLMAFLHGMQANGAWHEGRGTNFLDTGYHGYEVYETSDGKWVSIGVNEPQFYANLLRIIGLEDDDELRLGQLDASRWTEFKDRFATVFRTKTHDEWSALLEGEPEMCFAPVLDMNEAADHPHLKARGTFVELNGVVQPAPAPRFSRTPAEATPPRVPGGDTDAVLAELGYDDDERARLRAEGALG